MELFRILASLLLLLLALVRLVHTARALCTLAAVGIEHGPSRHRLNA